MKYWHKVPSTPTVTALPLMKWARVNGKSTASETAALMAYVALIFMSEITLEQLGSKVQISAASYDDIARATSLSRKLISDGLTRLVELDLIRPIGSHQKRRYQITWPDTLPAPAPPPGWFKLPCQAIVRDGVILPFKNFTLRSKHELHAMKLYLYLAARRNNAWQYSLASYENINQRTGISENDVRKAISLLIGTGLLRSVDREHEVDVNAYGPNKYYLTGSNNLVGYDGTTEEM